MARPLRVALASLSIVFAGCSADFASRIDDGTRAVQGNIPASPLPPALPALPVLTPCPAGWRELPPPAVGGAVTCDPWPDGGVHACAQDEAHFPGTPGCSRIGSDCPAGEWPEGLPTPVPVRYVRAGGLAGGDGSTATPFGSVAAALVTAAPGTILALGKGTFDEAVQLPAQITLWGACVAQTHLVRSAASTGYAVSVLGDGAAVRNLHIGGPQSGLRINVAGTRFEMRDLVIAGAQSIAVLAYNAVQLTGSRVVIRDTQPQPGTNAEGRGLSIEHGAQADLKWVSIESNRLLGVSCSGAGTRVGLEDTVVRDTKSVLGTGDYGRGLSVTNDGKFEGKRLVLERNQEFGFIAESGGSLLLTDAVVRDSLPTTRDPDSGMGGLAHSGAHAELRRVLVQRSRYFGLYILEPGSTLVASDLVVRDTLEAPMSKNWGHGLDADKGASVTAVRISLEHNRGAGLGARNAGTVVVLEDATALHHDGQVSDGLDGEGFAVTTGARLTVTRAMLEDNQCSAIVAVGAGTELTLVDVTVRGTRGCLFDGLKGNGLTVQGGASAAVTRILLEKNRSTAVMGSNPGTRLTLTDLAARDTFGEMRDGGNGGQFGEGLWVQAGAQAEVTRARIERSREAGIVAFGGTITGAQIVVLQTLTSDCPPSRCSVQAGIGAGVFGSGQLSLSVFSISDNASLGLQLATGGTADLRAGEIAGNPIGVNVQTTGYDLGRLQADVVFRGNATNIDSTTLPLPPVPPSP